MLIYFIGGIWYALCAFTGGTFAEWLVRRREQKRVIDFCKKMLRQLEQERAEYEREQALWEQAQQQWDAENYVFGVAGEDINAGDLVTIGAADGLIKKSRNEQ